MRNFKKNLTVSLLAALLLFACSEKNLLMEDVNSNVTQEIPANSDSETFVSIKKATDIAEMFLNREVGFAKTRATVSLAKTTVETVRDEKSGNAPAMYVVNYPEGGWVIVSATRNYYPILA
ncbi:MAG: Spi family protease inhibitor, partial [Bacteroidales bacterium]|nr:Spi family protease inhibitor [Bacteroidales bacterium]